MFITMMLSDCRETALSSFFRKYAITDNIHIAINEEAIRTPPIARCRMTVISGRRDFIGSADDVRHLFDCVVPVGKERIHGPPVTLLRLHYELEC